MKRYLKLFLNYLKRLDKLLILLCLVACGFSIVLLYTMNENDISSYVFERHYKMQIYMTLLGLALALVIAGINYHTISKLWFIYAPITLILTLLLFTPLGVTVEGADDIGWLNIGFTAIQPSEFLKITFIMTFSTHLSKLGRRINQIPHFILLCIHGVIPVALISVQGDDGTALVFLFMFISMMFAAGLWWRYIIAGLIAAPVGIYIAWNYVMQPHHKLRFLVLYDEAVQAEQMINLYDQQRRGLIAIGSGELTGKGLLGADYTYVPAMQTDFIFSYIGMTLGFIGCIATVCLLLLICVKILHVSFVALDMLGRIICVGTFSMFLFHSVINIGMALAVIPVIGIPLPFISAGGSSLLALYGAIGLVLSVYMHKDKQHHMFYTEKE